MARSRSRDASKLRYPADDFPLALAIGGVGVLGFLYLALKPKKKAPDNAVPDVRSAVTEANQIRADFYKGGFGRDGVVPDDASYRALQDRFSTLKQRLLALRAAESPTSPAYGPLTSAIESLSEVSGGALTYKARKVLATPTGQLDPAMVAQLAQEAQAAGKYGESVAKPLQRLYQVLTTASGAIANLPNLPL